jgi:hypothetical protein
MARTGLKLCKRPQDLAGSAAHALLGPIGRRSARRSARCRPREALLLGMCQHVALQFFDDQAADRRITWT